MKLNLRKTKNKFFLQVVSTILVVVLVLISWIFVCIYQNVKKNAIEDIRHNEQENIMNLSYTATIMNDTANSLLNQLYSNVRMRQLVYSDLFDADIATINAMNLFLNFSSFSMWIDSAYIYNANYDSVIYTYYASEYTHLSFTALEDFWDSEFISEIKTEKNISIPVFRTLAVPYAEEEQKVFTYYMPVKNSPNSYDGFYVINVNVERVLELCRGITGSNQRQIFIFGGQDNFCTNDTKMLSIAEAKELYQKLDSADALAGMERVSGKNGNYFCSWYKLSDFPLMFISCVSEESILQQLISLRKWFLHFYFMVLIITVMTVILISKKFDIDQKKFQSLYEKMERKYEKGEALIADALLRSFLRGGANCKETVELFSVNNIKLDKYDRYSLILLKWKMSHIRQNEEEEINIRLIIQSLLNNVWPKNITFEGVDVMMNCYFLIVESTDEKQIKKCLEDINEQLSKNYNSTFQGLCSIDVPTLEEIPVVYQQLVEKMEFLYFYPNSTLVNYADLCRRNYNGYNTAKEVCERVIYELDNRKYENAVKIFDEWFAKWYESQKNVHKTLDCMTQTFGKYIAAFPYNLGIAAEFDMKLFRNILSQCDYADGVKTICISLIEDIKILFSENSRKNHYIDKIYSVIQEEYTDSSFNMEVLAKKTGLSSSYMQSLFKTTTGISIAKYLRQYRLEKAEELLRDTDMAVNDIAIQIGYTNTNYFYTVFKKNYSLTPSEYRAKFMKK